MSGAGVLGGLRSQAQQTIAGKALTLARTAAGRALDPARQWWNLPAKYVAAEKIKDEMLHAHHGWNDADDAMRHAELSRRMAADIDPATSLAAGFAHEVENTIPAPPADLLRQAPAAVRDHLVANWHGQRRPERAMDVHNNLEGIRAGVLSRPVDPAALQIHPDYSEGDPPPYGK